MESSLGALKVDHLVSELGRVEKGAGHVEKGGNDLHGEGFAHKGNGFESAMIMGRKNKPDSRGFDGGPASLFFREMRQKREGGQGG